MAQEAGETFLVPIVWIPPAQWATSEQSDAVGELWRAEPLGQVASALTELDLQPLLVGGVVRDLLLDRRSNDLDLIVNCRAKKLMKMGVRLGQLTRSTPVPLDKERGTLRLCFSPAQEIDLVSLQGKDLWEDLSRRDLRINSMAIDAHGNLADPFQGREDLVSGVLREIRSENFEHDPLRVIRAVRFAAQLDCLLEAKTILSARAAAAGLKRVAGERISAELEKFFDYSRPNHVELLREIEVMVPIYPREHYDWGLLKEMCGQSPPGLGPGLAALYGPCLPEGERNPLFERLKLSRKLRRFIEHWWEGANRAGQMTEAPLEEIFHLSKRAGEAFGELAKALVCEAFQSGLPKPDRLRILAESQGEGELRWEPVPWNGADLSAQLDREPGPWLGEGLRQLEKQWALRRVDNLQEALRFLV